MPNRPCGEDDLIGLGFVDTCDPDRFVEARPIALIATREHAPHAAEVVEGLA